jgi:hypothetical protein
LRAALPFAGRYSRNIPSGEPNTGASFDSRPGTLPIRLAGYVRPRRRPARE